MRRAVEPGHVFVGGTPLLHPGYVRINADHFKYLFYAPGFTPETILELNPKMQWIPLEDDFISTVTAILLPECAIRPSSLRRNGWSVFSHPEFSWLS